VLWVTGDRFGSQRELSMDTSRHLQCLIRKIAFWISVLIIWSRRWLYIARHLCKYAHQPTIFQTDWLACMTCTDERFRWDSLTCGKLTDYMGNAVRRIDIYYTIYEPANWMNNETNTSVYWKIWTEVNFWDHKLFRVGMISDRCGLKRI